MKDIFANDEIGLVILLGPLLLANAVTQYFDVISGFFIYAGIYAVCLMLVFFRQNNRFYIIISFAPLIKIIQLSLEASFLNSIYLLIILYLAWLGMLFLAKESLALNFSRKSLLLWPIVIGMGLILGIVEYVWLGSGLWLQNSIYAIILLGVLAAIAEEFYFRRSLYGKFKAEHAAVVVSLLYVAMLPSWNIGNVIIFLGVNLIFCDLYRHTKNIMMPILAHAAMNITVMLIMPNFLF